MGRACGATQSNTPLPRLDFRHPGLIPRDATALGRIGGGGVSRKPGLARKAGSGLAQWQERVTQQDGGRRTISAPCALRVKFAGNSASGSLVRAKKIDGLTPPHPPVNPHGTDRRDFAAQAAMAAAGACAACPAATSTGSSIIHRQGMSTQKLPEGLINRHAGADAFDEAQGGTDCEGLDQKLRA